MLNRDEREAVHKEWGNGYDWCDDGLMIAASRAGGKKALLYAADFLQNRAENGWSNRHSARRQEILSCASILRNLADNYELLENK